MAHNTYDVFISYAIEDKIEIAHELYRELQRHGLKVWYAGQELRVGESIEKAILKGLEESRYGIVLITPNYFEKNWTRKELYSLLSKESEGQKVILPIFHKVTNEDVMKHDTLLSERWALTTDKGLDYVVQEIIKVVKGEVEKPEVNKSIFGHNNILLFILVVICFISIGLYKFFDNDIPDESLQKNLIENRISEFQTSMEADYAKYLEELSAHPTNQKEIIAIDSAFQTLSEHYRNNYEFSDGSDKIKFKKNIEPLLNFSFDTVSVHNNFSLHLPAMNKVASNSGNEGRKWHVLYLNTQPITYTIDHTLRTDSSFQVVVNYKNHIRQLRVTLEHGKRTSFRKVTTYNLIGLKPREIYEFVLKDDNWTSKAHRQIE